MRLRIILISALLFSFNGWTEILKLECNAFESMDFTNTVRELKSENFEILSIDTDKKEITLNPNDGFERVYEFTEKGKKIYWTDFYPSESILDRYSGEWTRTIVDVDGSIFYKTRYICKRPLF